MRAKDVLEVLQQKGINPDKFFYRSGVFTVRFGYFYRNGKTPENFWQEINKVIPVATKEELNDVWQAWPKDSYFEVKFKI